VAASIGLPTWRIDRRDLGFRFVRRDILSCLGPRWFPASTSDGTIGEWKLLRRRRTTARTNQCISSLTLFDAIFAKVCDTDFMTRRNSSP
jgi:hypothetical protein